MSVRPKKSLGQHFLHDPNTIRKIAAAVEAPPAAPVVEIGPGTGALTEELLRHYPDVTAIEVDERAIEHLHETMPALDVRHRDVLEVDWAALAEEKGEALWVVGNLPYYITSPILFSLLDARRHLRRAVLMMQKEVAERLVAVPRTKAYGILSVQLQLFARPTLLFDVSRHVFRPKPDVTSAVIALDFPGSSPGQAAPNDLGVDVGQVRHTVRTAFNQRRKTLRNSLKPITSQTGHDVPPELAGRRPEALEPEEFLGLTRSIFGVGGA